MHKLCVSMAAVGMIAAQPAWGWGNEGHEIIATIARDELTPQAKAWVDAILAQDTDTLTAPDMVSRATWADRWRDSGHRETADWHFVDQELGRPDLMSACFGEPKPADPPSAGPAEDCVVDKIGEFQAELANSATPDAERLLALKYILHFVGDVHQPLHASDNQDEGGNCVSIKVGAKTSNLHSFWDTGVLAPLGSDPQTAAKALEKRITAADRKRWASGQASDWARASYAIAKTMTYTIHSPSGCVKGAAPIALTASYQSKALLKAKLQIEKAGVRLAWALNSAAAAANQPGG